MMRKHSFIMGVLLMIASAGISTACTIEIQRPEVTDPLMPDKGPEGTESIGAASVKRTSVYHSGPNNQVYRIPSIVTAKDGSLLIFCEDRHNSWVDKSYTDIVCKRSTDNGETWSASTSITGSINSGEYAYMDPTPVVDANGKIIVFFTRWNKLNTDVRNNRAFMSYSTDNGVTWSVPEDVSDRILAEGMFSSGFGPGHGIMIKDGKYAGRLVVITRQHNGSSGSGYCIWSDDNGENWHCGVATQSGEAQIAESGKDKLHLNIRRGAYRYTASSSDGGNSWSTPLSDGALPIIEGGCEASVLGTGNDIVFYCGPAGGPASSGHDNRYGLKLFRSTTNGTHWSKNQVLYELASGYSDMTLLEDGSLAIVFEAGPEKGFIKSSNRTPGWMRLDLIILPSDLTDYNFWF